MASNKFPEASIAGYPAIRLPAEDRPIQLAFRTRVSIAAALIFSSGLYDGRDGPDGESIPRAVNAAVVLESIIDEHIKRNREQRNGGKP